jgi:hypothetical protein
MLSKKPTIIFYSSKKLINDRVKKVRFIIEKESTKERIKIIREFNQGKIKALAVPKSMTTGWRVDYFNDEIDVQFYGDFSEEERVQALHRGKSRM